MSNQAMSDHVGALRQNRPLLLSLEAIGWLHMTGKARREFLEYQGGLIQDYDLKKWADELAEPWENHWHWIEPPSGFVLPKSFNDFLRKFDQGSAEKAEKNAVGLLQASHAMASGIEKNLPKNASKYLGQDATHMWLSTSFGKEVRNLLVNPPELLKDDNKWQNLLSRIDKLLIKLEMLGRENAGDVKAWWDWRKDAIGPTGWLREYFSSILSETRLPNNDVTLWDQSYVAAALFKSAAAGAVVAHGQFSWDNPKQQTRWRLFTVGIGADHYESRAVRIGDWIGARKDLDTFFEDVRRLIEVDLALGALLYRDNQVAVFSFPGQHWHNSGGMDDPTANAIGDYLRQEIDGLAQKVAAETPPYCHLSSSSRSLIIIGAEIEKARGGLKVPIHRSWSVPCCQTTPTGNICPVCGVRLNGDMTDKQKPCQKCGDRREGRRDSWLQGEIGKTTIWISEVADQNDRLALLTLSLPLEKWLNGSYVDSLRSQAATEWCRQNPKVQEYGIYPETAYKDLLAYIIKKVTRDFDRADPVLRILQDGYQQEAEWKTFFAKVVEDRSNSPQWEDLNAEERAKWLVHQLLRKNASPGRIYRFWRTTEDFFRDLFYKFLEIAAQDSNKWRVRRLVLEPDHTMSSGWQDGQVYGGNYQGIPVDLFYRGSSQDFLTVFNIARLPDSVIRDRTFRDDLKLKSDMDKLPRTVKVRSVRDEEGPLGLYYPVIPLEISPERFRVLVPLSAASKCLSTAIEAWKDQFSRVWDRLPLRAGVVAFTQKTPFQAVIEAARNVEEQLDIEQEEWRVISRVTCNGVTALQLKRPNGRNELQMVPVFLPDGRTDVFYRYVATLDSELRFPLDFREPYGQIFRHVQDLRRGDCVKVIPSLVAAVFLENTGERFRVVSKYSLSEWIWMEDLWQLLSGVGATTTAIRRAWQVLSEVRQRWCGPDGRWIDGARENWLTLVRSVMKGQVGVDGSVLDTIVEGAGADLLGPCLDWNMRVLKSSFGEVSR